MPVPPKVISPELLAEARRLYEHTRVPVDDIAALIGISTRTLYSRIRKWKWRRRQDRVPQISPPPEDETPSQPEHAEPTIAAEPFLDVAGSIEERIMRAIERQIHAMEKIVANLNPTPEHAEDVERAARALASLSRSLTELRALKATKADAKSEDADSIPRNLDDLRQELAARIERLAAASEGAVLRQSEEHG